MRIALLVAAFEKLDLATTDHDSEHSYSDDDGVSFNIDDNDDRAIVLTEQDLEYFDEDDFNPDESAKKLWALIKEARNDEDFDSVEYVDKFLGTDGLDDEESDDDDEESDDDDDSDDE